MGLLVHCARRMCWGVTLYQFLVNAIFHGPRQYPSLPVQEAPQPLDSLRPKAHSAQCCQISKSMRALPETSQDINLALDLRRCSGLLVPSDHPTPEVHIPHLARSWIVLHDSSLFKT